MKKILSLIEKNYSKLLKIFLIFSIIALIAILAKFILYHYIFAESIEVSGGTLVIIPAEYNLTTSILFSSLNDLGIIGTVQSTSNFYIIQAKNINVTDFLNILSSKYGINISQNSITVEQYNSTLGAFLFNQFFLLVVIAIVLVSLINLILYRSKEVTIAIVLTILFDLLVISFVLSILNIPIGYMGLVGMIMVVGFAIDNNIVLATNMLREKNREFAERARMSFKVGFLMELFILFLAISLLLLVNVENVREFAIVLLIGCVADLVYYLFVNIPLFKYFEVRKEKKIQTSTTS